MAKNKHDTSEELLDLALMEEKAGRSASRFSYLLSFSAVAAVVTFLVWADRAVLDEVTRGTGQIVSSSRTQVIQNLEGGIVDEIHINEGAIVEQGDLRGLCCQARSTTEHPFSLPHHDLRPPRQIVGRGEPVDHLDVIVWCIDLSVVGVAIAIVGCGNC